MYVRTERKQKEGVWISSFGIVGPETHFVSSLPTLNTPYTFVW